MVNTRIMARGVDTLIVNTFQTDERMVPVRRALDNDLVRQLEASKREAQGTHEEMPTSLRFNEKTLHWLMGRGEEYLERVKFGQQSAGE